MWWQKDGLMVNGLYSKTNGLIVGQTRSFFRTASGKANHLQSKKRGQSWLIEERNKLRENLIVTDDQINIGDFLDRYIKDVARHSLRPRTYERNYCIVNNHIRPELGNIKLLALSPDQVQAFYTKRLNEGLS